MESIKAVLMNNSTLKTLNLSLWKVTIKLFEVYMLFCRFLSPNTNILMDSMKENNLRGIVSVTLLYDIYVNQKFLFILFAGDVHNQIFEPTSQIEIFLMMESVY